MIAEIISVGTELLMGQVANTDAQHIAQGLAPLGFICRYQITVGDNISRLTDVVDTALERSDIVLFTGGLGPTDDDLTKETVAAAMGLTCVPFPDEVEKLKSYFVSRGREMTPNNLKQASFPEGSIILPNPLGTAPGCIMEKDGKAAILMPGPPRELFPMFTNFVIPYLEKRCNRHLYSKKLQFFGIGESKLTYEIRDLIENQTNPTIASYVKLGEVMLRITADCTDDKEGESLIRPMEQEIISRVGDYIYSDLGETLAETTIRILGEAKKTVSVFETFTGGAVSSALSESDTEGTVLKESKVVPSESGNCEALAEMIQNRTNSDYSVAVEKISKDDIVRICVSDANGAETREVVLKGDNERIRTMTVLHTLDTLRRRVLGKPQLQDMK